MQLGHRRSQAVPETEGEKSIGYRQGGKRRGPPQGFTGHRAGRQPVHGPDPRGLKKPRQDQDRPDAESHEPENQVPAFFRHLNDQPGHPQRQPEKGPRQIAGHGQGSGHTQPQSRSPTTARLDHVQEQVTRQHHEENQKGIATGFLAVPNVERIEGQQDRSQDTGPLPEHPGTAKPQEGDGKGAGHGRRQSHPKTVGMHPNQGPHNGLIQRALDSIPDLVPENQTGTGPDLIPGQDLIDPQGLPIQAVEAEQGCRQGGEDQIAGKPGHILGAGGLQPIRRRNQVFA